MMMVIPETFSPNANRETVNGNAVREWIVHQCTALQCTAPCQKAGDPGLDRKRKSFDFIFQIRDRVFSQLCLHVWPANEVETNNDDDDDDDDILQSFGNAQDPLERIRYDAAQDFVDD